MEHRSQHNSLADEMEMAAIWYEYPVVRQSDNSVTRRITDGDHICVMDGGIVQWWVSSRLSPTHIVIGCFGTITSSKLSLLLWNIQEQNIETFIIK